MERLNLNIPEVPRKVLKRMARRAGLREAEYARVLLLRAIEEAEREEFFRGFAEAQTPEVRRRQLEVARAMERLRG